MRKKDRSAEMETEQAPNQKTQGDQAKEKNARMQGPDLHRLSCSLPAGGNIDLRKLHGQGERPHLRKIADSQPAYPLPGSRGLRNSVITAGTTQKNTSTSLGQIVPSGACR